MDKDITLEVLRKIVKIDEHTDNIKDEMKKIYEAQASIVKQMGVIGNIYVEILLILKKDCEENQT